MTEGYWPVRASPDLADVVASMVAYAQTGMRPGVHHGMPSTSLTFIVTLGEPLRTSATREEYERGERHSDEVLLGGLHTRSAYVHQPTQWAGLQVGLAPLAARRVFGMPAAEIPTSSYDAVDLLGPGVVELRARLHEVVGWDRRFALVEAYLRDRVRRFERVRAARPEIGAAWRMIRTSGGTRAVGAVCDQVGLGRRQLAKVFAAETGVTPKTLGRLTRFERACGEVGRRARSGAPLDVAEIAHQVGYFDHAHLVRDFQDFADLTPTGWAQEVANIQAPAHTIEASWTHERENTSTDRLAQPARS